MLIYCEDRDRRGNEIVVGQRGTRTLSDLINAAVSDAAPAEAATVKCSCTVQRSSTCQNTHRKRVSYRPPADPKIHIGPQFTRGRGILRVRIFLVREDFPVFLTVRE